MSEQQKRIDAAMRRNYNSCQPGTYEQQQCRWIISREEALDARIEAHTEAREQHEDEISDAREIEEHGEETE